MSSAWIRTHLLPNSIVARITAVLFSGILIAQILGTWLWIEQLKTAEFHRLIQISENMGARMGQTIKFFGELPSQYRHIVLDQLRDMGGTRFFVSVNKKFIEMESIEETELSVILHEKLKSSIFSQIGTQKNITIQFIQFENLKILSGINDMVDLPAKWKRFSLIQDNDLSPTVVVQLELNGEWMYLATPIPEGTLLLGINWLNTERFLSLALVSITVLILTLLLVRWVAKPLKLLAKQVEIFGKGGNFEHLEEQGSSEMIATIRAFNTMVQRLKKFINERERLFSTISHDLKTPLTRARLRAEMLDDEEVRDALIGDLENLDTMVKGSLQMMKDNVIHENTESINLSELLTHLLEKEQIRSLPIESNIQEAIYFEGRPVALERLFSNLIDNAFKYSRSVEVDAEMQGNTIKVKIKDRGPGLSDTDKINALEPYNRLNQKPNKHNVGLGLSIASSIAHLHGGGLKLKDRSSGRGLVAEVFLPLK